MSSSAVVRSNVVVEKKKRNVKKLKVETCAASTQTDVELVPVAVVQKTPIIEEEKIKPKKIFTARVLTEEEIPPFYRYN